jgi:hypothetical protein
MKILKVRKLNQGGEKLAVDTVENVFIAGSDHLVDKGLLKRTKKWSFCCSCISICLFSLIIIALITFTTKYFIQKYDYKNKE